MTESVFRVRIDGREGHGATTAAQLLAAAASRDGRHAQALRTFGRERTGAPVTAYCRIGGLPSCTPDVEVDALVIQDAMLVHHPHVLEGLGAEGFLVVNARSGAHLGLGDLTRTLAPGHIVTVPATDLALAYGGRPYTALLGALAAVTGAVSLEALTAAIEERFAGEVARDNVAAATQAYHALRPMGSRTV